MVAVRRMHTPIVHISIDCTGISIIAALASYTVSSPTFLSRVAYNPTTTAVISIDYCIRTSSITDLLAKWARSIAQR